MSDDFYRAFEERHYAPQSVIKQIRRQYLPFVQQLATLHRESQTFDVGCGRGEWLELMTEIGLKPFGVDLDDGMLRACHEKGLRAQQGDAVQHLKTLPNESQLIVSAFHVVEHITFSELRTVVSEALRVLKPGGLLIMETPNPENIVVATRNFYLDPTHQKPIPPGLLSFLPEYYGFANVKTIRLQEAKDLAAKPVISLADVLHGASPDYAVVAQKSAVKSILDTTKLAFSTEYGLTLETLAELYDKQTANRIKWAETADEQVNVGCKVAEQAQQALESAARAETQVQQAVESAARVEALLIKVTNSRSWRITAPLRWCGLQARRLRVQGFSTPVKALTKKISRPIVRRALVFVNARPALRQRCVLIIHQLGLYDKIRSLYSKLQGLSYMAPLDAAGPNVITELADLSPHALRIYQDLNDAIQKNRKVS